MAKIRLKVGYVGSHLPSYFAHEYEVFNRSIRGLETLAQQLDFDLYVIREPLVSAEDAHKASREIAAAGVDFVLLQNSTFAMGDVVKALVGGRAKLGLWAVEEPTKEGAVLLNNLVSLNLNASVLTRYLRPAVPFKWFFGYPGHPWFTPRLAITVQALKALKRLSQTRIGLVGGIAPTFYNFAFDERNLEARLGVQVFAHELAEVFERVQRENPAVPAVVEALSAYAHGRVEVSSEDMQVSSAIYLALRDLAGENGYDALAVSDWPQFQRVLNLHPGMAFSWLDETDGIPVASEGDVLGAASMLLLREVSGQGTMLLDFTDIDLELEAILSWHCGGSPLHLADDRGVIWKNHSTLGRKNPLAKPTGAVADFRFRPQPVTLTRISADGDQLLVMDADVIEGSSPGFEGSRGWLAHFRLNHHPIGLADLVNTVMVEGLEHHFILGSGQHSEALSEFAAWTGMKVIEAVPYRNHMQLGSRSLPLEETL